MKIGITYLYTILNYGYPPKVEDDFKAIEEIERMGFHYLEMEGLGGRHTEGVWNNRNVFRKRLDAHNIHVHNFCGVDPDLVSLDNNKRKAAYESFKRTAELAVYLGAETLHLASYAPPVEYIGKAPYQLDESYSFGDTFRMHIPDDFSWERLWSVLVESCRFTAEVAAQYNRTVIMEPRVAEVICSADSMIRLIKDVNMDNFKANFDTGHFSAQRENVPLALKKLEGQFANIHIADNNPIDTNHLPIGAGTIDWYEFFRILKLMNYTGYLGLDLGKSEHIEQDYKLSLERIKIITDKLGIELQW
ncbi:MAG: sugar phosphate isomerase/epimerase [Eubacteriales bacterium]|nr:sugar phosphate isomerase/epimerase [Eubacteriales bacterium]